MAWSYSNNPGYSAKDQVRYLIGDTNIKDPLLADEEISWTLSQYNNVPLNAAIRCCEAVISKFSRLADETVGAVSIMFSQKCKAYSAMQNMLRARLATEAAIPFAGGITVLDKIINRENCGLIRPDFTKQMMINRKYSSWITTSPYDYFLDYFE